MIILFASLPLLIVATSRLFFSTLEASGSCYASYSPHEIKLSNTVLNLEDGVISVSGLGDTEHLICFREGKLIFPNNPLDHTIEHQLAVYEGDEFIWFKFKGIPPANFSESLFPEEGERPSLERMLRFRKKASNLFTFEVKNSAPLMARVKSKIASWNRFALPIGFSLFIVFGAIMVIACVIYFSPNPKDWSYDYNDSDLRKWRPLVLTYNETSESHLLHLEISKNIPTRPFNLSEYLDRVSDCLASQFPHRDPYEWQDVTDLSLIEPSRYYYWRGIPSNNCSLPPQ